VPEMNKKPDWRESESRILAEQNRHLYGSLPSILFITSLVALVLVTTHWNLVPRTPQLVWLSAFVLFSIARFALLLAYRSESPLPGSSFKWYARFRNQTLLSAILWGSSAWVFLSPDAPYDQALLTFVVAGLGAGGVVNLAARWQCAWLFLLPTLLPFAARFLMLDFPLATATAVLIVLFIAALMLMSVQLSRKTLGYIRAELRQAQQAEIERRQHQHYQSLVESTTAIIWEGDPDTLEFRYVSPESEKLLGYSPEQWTSDPQFWQRHIHPEDRDWALDYCSQAVRNRQEHTFDYRMIASDGRIVWLRDIVNVVVEGGKPQKLVGVMIDISELKETQGDLEYVSGLQRLMVDVSRDLFETDESTFDNVYAETLEKIGRWCRADRAYLIRLTPDLRHLSNTHEWVAPGISAEIQNIQNLPTATVPMLLERLMGKEPVVLPRIVDLDDGWAAEKSLFAQQHIQSLICLPIFSAEHLVGMIGFDSVRELREWSDEETALLQVLGDLIGVAIERTDKERQLRASEELRTHAEALAGMGSWEWIVGSEAFMASTEWRNVAGCGNGPLTRKQVLALTPADERLRVTQALERTTETGEPYNIQHRIIRPDNGERRWVEVHAELVDLGDQGKSLRGFAQDITERKITEQKLFNLAHYDSLTGMPNRVLVQDRLQQALRRARRNGSQVALLFLDLDQFKKVNDTLGHDAGDRTLVDAALRLKGILRDRDTVARIGGDEFVIVLEDFEQVSDVISSASKVIEAFRKPLTVSGREFMLTASIGIALSPQDGATGHDLLRNADTALYHAKNRGRDGYQFFTRSMNKTVERRLALEEALRGAVARKEFHLHYQPLFRPTDRVCVGAEALLRWRHPELGDVSPDEFVDVAEQGGLIQEIGDFVIEMVVKQVVEWRSGLSPDFCVSVNVSPRQFRDPRLAEKIISAMNDAGLSGDGLEIEVTEGVLLPGRNEVVHTLKTLRQKGVGIVMDDFGTGYASLSYLRDHPFTSLKIDRSFIGNLKNDERQRQLVVSALRLGEALGMKVVAEGVETEEQLEVLVEEGCQLVQGFLLSRPVEPDRIAETLAAQRH